MSILEGQMEQRSWWSFYTGYLPGETKRTRSAVWHVPLHHRRRHYEVQKPVPLLRGEKNGDNDKKRKHDD